MRDQEEIDAQIRGLESMKEWLPRTSGFGTPNHEIIDAQVRIIRESTEPQEIIDEMDWEGTEMSSDLWNAEEWVNEDKDEDLWEAAP